MGEPIDAFEGSETNFAGISVDIVEATAQISSIEYNQIDVAIDEKILCLRDIIYRAAHTEAQLLD